MKNLFLLIFWTTIALSCKHKSSSQKQQLSVAYAQPVSLPLNTDKGYAVNVITGDSIQPVQSNYKGPVRADGSLLFKKKTLSIQPKALMTGDSIKKEVPIYSNIVPIGKPVTYQIKGQTHRLKDKQSIVINPLKDTIFSRIPIATQGKKRVLLSTPPVQIGTLRYKDETLQDIQNFGIQQGMYSSTIYDVCKSKKGGLWLATYDGISYYDGTLFTHYTQKEGLPNGNVRSILEDSKGNIWFCPKGRGICRYDGDSLTIFNNRHGLMHNNAFNVKEDEQGNIWWSSTYGLTKFDGKNLVHYYLGNSRYTKLHIDAKGHIWTNSRGEIIRFNELSVTRYKLDEIAPGLKVATIFEDKQGNMWFGLHSGGVLKYNGQHFTQYAKEQGLPGNSVYSVTQDHEGHIWLGTDRGLVKQVAGNFTNHTTKDGLAGNVIIKILEDDLQNLWLGTYKKGLVRYKPRSFTHQNLQGNRKDDIVRAFCQDKKDNLWIATRNSGLVEFKGDKRYTVSLNKRVTYALAADRQNNIWVGVRGGVIKYTKGKLLFYPLINQTRHVLTLLEDSQGNIWIGSEDLQHSVIKYDGENFVHYELPYATSVKRIIEDRQGTIWFGTGVGVYKLKGEKLKVYSERQGLSGPTITDLLEDAHGNIWLGTYEKGLMRFDGKAFTYYTTREGLPSNFIKSIIEDKQGNIWLGTEKGLSCLQAQKTQKTNSLASFKVINYDQSDGLKAMDFEPRSVHLDNNNMLWWGTGRTVVNLKLDDFKTPVNVPKMRLRHIDINGHFWDFRMLSDKTKRAIQFNKLPKFDNYPLNPTIDYNHNQIKFHFSAIDIENPQKISYSYRMKGLERSWSRLSKQTFAEYRSLPFGSYTFQVKAIGAAKSWSKILEYSFRVRPPWWQTWWAKLLFILTILVFIALYVKWRLANLVRNQQLLEIKVQERTLDLHKAVRQLNNLNIDLKRSREEVIQLKEKERKILTNQIKERENELLLTMKMVDEKLSKVATIKDDLLEAIQEDDHNSLLSVAQDLSQFLKSTNDLEILAERIEVKYPGMLMKLKMLYPQLSTNDVKHCLYIKLGLTLKESAQLLNVSVHAVKMARQRLKKKMAIPENLSLKCFIVSEF